MKTTATTTRPAWALWDSTAGTYTRRDVIRAAWTIYAAAVREFLCSTYTEVKQPRHDQRYKFNREAEQVAREIIRRKGMTGIRNDREKHRERCRAKAQEARRPVNVLALPIVRDYRENRHSLRRVCSDHLDFYGRNHWAKNDRDRQALAILGAHFGK